MNFKTFNATDAATVEKLFVSVFSDSEGATEGGQIGKLVKELIDTTDELDLYGFVAMDDFDTILGAIFFSRLTFETNVNAFILSPVAVDSDQQGKGIGQALITYGLKEMKKQGVQFVVTYGDPAFYTKVGFRVLSQDVVRPPFELAQPQGWIGQSLIGETIAPIPGRCACVNALNNSEFW